MIRTLARPVRHEPPKVKGSRFIASIAPVETPDAAMAFVDARRLEFQGASHHCFAWRVGGEDSRTRFSDDGEPSGTAGRPILRQLDGRDLTDVVAVVTRYFGGIKLGTGGLIRAYGGAVTAALELAEVVERPVVERLRLTFAYTASGAVQSVLAAFGLEPSAADYGGEVTMDLAVPVADVERLEAALRDATRGRLGCIRRR